MGDLYHRKIQMQLFSQVTFLGTINEVFDKLCTLIYISLC